MVTAGDDVGGYTLLTRLGSGGMGAVWHARASDGSDVALKLLHPAFAADPEARARLVREVASLRRVQGDRVARVLDAEVEDDTAFIVTQLIDGLSLEQSVAQEGAFDPVDVHPMAQGLAEAIQAVHQAGLLHRDIKPGNVMLTYSGPVLIDFGIAQLADDSRLTHTGFVTGTPGYLDPATLAGGALSHDGDWYGWAAVLLFAATGRPPFGKGPFEAVLGRMTTGMADVDGLDPRVAAAFKAALDPNPTRRHGPEALITVLQASAEGTLDALPAALDATQLVAAPPLPSAIADGGAPTMLVPPPPGPVAGARAPLAEPPTAQPMPQPTQTSSQQTPIGSTRQMPAIPGQHHYQEPAPGRYAPGPTSPAGMPSPYPLPPHPGGGADLVAHGPSGFAVPDPAPVPSWAQPPPARSGLIAASGAVMVALSMRWPGVAVVGTTLGFVLLTCIGMMERRTRRRRLLYGKRRSDGWASAGWSIPALALAVVTAILPLAVGAVVAGCCWWLGYTLLGTGSLGLGLPADFELLVTPIALAAGLVAAWWVPLAETTRSGARHSWRALASTAQVRRMWVLVLLIVAGLLVLAGLIGEPVWVPFSPPPTPGG